MQWNQQQHKFWMEHKYNIIHCGENLSFMDFAFHFKNN